MPEPKKNIGDQLRAFAQRRRDAAGAPFEPHPVTRKLLQDEVARTFSARTIARQATSSIWLATFWVRLSFAGGLVAFLVIAVIFWLPKDSQSGTKLTRKSGLPDQQPSSTLQLAVPSDRGGIGGGGTVPPDLLALNQKQNEPELARHYGLIPQPAPEPDVFFRKPEADTSEAPRSPKNQRAEPETSPKLGFQRDGSAVASVPALSPGAAAPSLEAKSNSTGPQAPLEAVATSVDKVSKLEEIRDLSTLDARDKAAADELRAAKEVALASATGKRTEVRLSLASDVPVTNMFFFSQADTSAKYRRNFNSPPVLPVLRSFRVQQSGANIRFIDADGSVYEGVAEPPVADSRLRFGEIPGSEERSETKNLLAEREGNIEPKSRPGAMPSVATGTTRGFGRLMFRARGTNQSVNQLVVISGELQPGTNSIAEVRYLGPSGTRSQAVTVRAKASIGRNVEIPIEASGTAR